MKRRPGKIAEAFFVLVLATGAAMQAQTFTVLYSFTGGSDGGHPETGLIREKAGNLYGTTLIGGASGYGTVFKLDTSGNETVLHSFTGNDGAFPEAVLIKDRAGNLYGTTPNGGASSSCSGGCGTVFKLDTSGNETVLHSFTGNDGAFPAGGLLMDKAGNLYGTTYNGGASIGSLECGSLGCGTVFKLDTSGNETVLHSFTGYPSDGQGSYATLIMDKAGNLYGTTVGGGASNVGTVFKLDTSGNETVLHSFTGYSSDAAIPEAGLIMDKAGNLYGTTANGGTPGIAGYGTVFKLDTSGNETVLHTFTNSGGDGFLPLGALIMDKTGNLYGTTELGGAGTCSSGQGLGCGTVFRLDSSGNETVVYSFRNSGGEGTYPEHVALIMDKAGNLYGTTVEGGASSYGTVFKLK